MSQQMQGECYTCHQKIFLSKPSPDSKWIKTNLDGSAHVDAYQSKPKPPQQQQQQQIDRQNAIQAAHDDNMEASEKLRLAIVSLAEKVSDIDRTLTTLTEVIRSKA